MSLSAHRHLLQHGRAMYSSSASTPVSVRSASTLVVAAPLRRLFHSAAAAVMHPQQHAPPAAAAAAVRTPRPIHNATARQISTHIAVPQSLSPCFGTRVASATLTAAAVAESRRGFSHRAHSGRTATSAAPSSSVQHEFIDSSVSFDDASHFAATTHGATHGSADSFAAFLAGEADEQPQYPQVSMHDPFNAAATAAYTTFDEHAATAMSADAVSLNDLHDAYNHTLPHARHQEQQQQRDVQTAREEPQQRARHLDEQPKLSRKQQKEQKKLQRQQQRQHQQPQDTPAFAASVPTPPHWLHSALQPKSNSKCLDARVAMRLWRRAIDEEGVRPDVQLYTMLLTCLARDWRPENVIIMDELRVEMTQQTPPLYFAQSNVNRLAPAMARRTATAQRLQRWTEEDGNNLPAAVRESAKRRLPAQDSPAVSTQRRSSGALLAGAALTAAGAPSASVPAPRSRSPRLVAQPAEVGAHAGRMAHLLGGRDQMEPAAVANVAVAASAVTAPATASSKRTDTPSSRLRLRLQLQALSRSTPCDSSSVESAAAAVGADEWSCEALNSYLICYTLADGADAALSTFRRVTVECGVQSNPTTYSLLFQALAREWRPETASLMRGLRSQMRSHEPPMRFARPSIRHMLAAFPPEDEARHLLDEWAQEDGRAKELERLSSKRTMPVNERQHGSAQAQRRNALPGQEEPMQTAGDAPTAEAAAAGDGDAVSAVGRRQRRRGSSGALSAGAVLTGRAASESDASVSAPRSQSPRTAAARQSGEGSAHAGRMAHLLGGGEEESAPAVQAQPEAAAQAAPQHAHTAPAPAPVEAGATDAAAATTHTPLEQLDGAGATAAAVAAPSSLSPAGPSDTAAAGAGAVAAPVVGRRQRQRQRGSSGTLSAGAVLTSGSDASAAPRSQSPRTDAVAARQSGQGSARAGRMAHLLAGGEETPVYTNHRTAFL